MSSPALIDAADAAVPVAVVPAPQFPAWLRAQNARVRTWLEAIRFTPEPGSYTLIPDKDGSLATVLAVIGPQVEVWSIAHLPAVLPARAYRLDGKLNTAQATLLALGWAWGSYRFTRYKSRVPEIAMLVMPKEADAAYVRSMAESAFLARDLINTPAGDMLPSHLAEACLREAKAHKAKVVTFVGEELLAHHYPSVYTVGKASVNAPRLVDIRYGKASAPKVTLVGKGVCFDSGGLHIKPASNMRLMKKDMAGVAILLALGRVIMKRKLDVRLRMLFPLVENAVSGSAMRPLDVITTRKGLTVEIGDTDAEGRLTICDALTEADSEKPDLLIDCTTLTGAARVALGTDMPAFFTPDDALAARLSMHCLTYSDPLYRLPLWTPYRDMLESHTADISNDTDSAYAGAITAALFLKEFVEQTPSWLHLDMMAWNLTPKPGRPVGAEPQGLRALYALIEERYG